MHVLGRICHLVVPVVDGRAVDALDRQQHRHLHKSITNASPSETAARTRGLALLATCSGRYSWRGVCVPNGKLSPPKQPRPRVLRLREWRAGPQQRA